VSTRKGFQDRLRFQVQGQRQKGDLHGHVTRQRLSAFLAATRNPSCGDALRRGRLELRPHPRISQAGSHSARSKA
jgi:hypothetical protein